VNAQANDYLVQLGEFAKLSGVSLEKSGLTLSMGNRRQSEDYGVRLGD